MLTRRIGPLPAWAWGAIVGGGILAAMWWRSRSSGGATDGSQTDATGGDGSGTSSLDSADLPDSSDWPAAPGYGGFNDAPPPAYPDPNSRIDPALLKAIRNLTKATNEETRRRERNTKRHKKHPHKHPHPPARNYPGGNPGGPPRRHVAAHHADAGPLRPGVM